MREMAMAQALGFGIRGGHLRDGASPGLAGASASPFCGNRRALQRLVAFSHPRPTPLIVHASRSQIRTPEQDQLGSSTEFQTLSSPPTTTIPPAQSGYFGSPLLWVGVGVGLSVFFSWAANYGKKQVMQQAFKSMMAENQFGTLASPPFPFPPPVTQPATSPQPVQPPVSTPETTVTAAVVETTQVVSEAPPVSENNKPAFKDFDVEAETKAEAATEEKKEEKSFFKDAEVKDSGAGFSWNTDGAASTSDGKASSFFSVDTLEKMLEDPTVQQMVYPYLPQEMRNPSTFKWMMQNPQFRSQLQEMLNNMTEDGTLKSGQMSEVMKNFNPNNQELKQQFEQIGLSPEEVMAKMVANPDIAMAFQNPKIQAALIDCSQNPANITKYQSDKEIMDVFNKIAELFPMKGF